MSCVPLNLTLGAIGLSAALVILAVGLVLAFGRR